MLSLSRRAVLASTTSLVFASAAHAAPWQTPVGLVIGSGPPKAPVRPVVETLWGQTVTDRYRWMERLDAEWQSYAKAQGAYTAEILAKLPGRDKLTAAIAKNTAAITAVLSVQTGGSKIFVELRPAGAELSQLYVRDGMNGTQRLLIDPDHFAKPGTHAALDWWAASPDGSHVVFGASQGGSEQSVLRILVTDSGALLPEAIDRTADASPSWLPDGSGFFYNRLQNVPPDSLAYEEDSAAWLHLLGTDPATDAKVLAMGLDPKVSVQDIDFPGIGVTPGSDVALGYLISGVQNELTLYAATLPTALAAKPHWTKIADPSDDVTGAAVRGSDIYLLSHKNASRFKVLKTTAVAPSIAHAVEVVPQSFAVIESILAARDALYIQDLRAGLGGLRRLAPDGTLTTIDLPFAGSISGLYADTLHDGVWFMLQSWVHPYVICHAGPDGRVTATDLAPLPPIDVTAYTSEEVMITARDGVRVPLSIVYKKGLTRDGSAPVVLEAYGSYGINLDPFFVPRWLPFFDAGGVYAIAHVRGGGELGEDWHLAGKGERKYHTWQDTEDAAQYLIDQHWTAHKRLAIMGESAGGITVGRFVTERPDLAAVVISMVGCSNATRSEFSPNGPPNIPEFGTVKTQAGFHNLFAMDAYQHVHDGVKYPSVLVTTGLNDPRVPPWEPTKFAARLQAATASKNPVLLWVDSDAGHGFGSTRNQRDVLFASLQAFVLWRTGVPGWQPRA